MVSGRGRSVEVWFLGLLLIVFAAGCTQVPSQSSLTKPGETGVVGNSLKDQGLQLFMARQLDHPLPKWPLSSWNETGFTLAAWYFNPRLDKLRGQWERAERKLRKIEGLPELDLAPSAKFPHGMLSGLLSATRSDGQPPLPSIAKIPNTGWNINHQLRRIGQAERTVELLRLHLETVAWQVRIQVHTNLLAYVTARRGEVLLKELEENYVKLVHAGEDAVATGMMSDSQLTLSRLRLAQIRLALIKTRLVKMDSRDRLAQSLNVPVNELFDVVASYDLSQEAAGELTVSGLRWQALHYRPDILAALLNYHDSESGLRREMAAKGLDFQFPPGCRWDTKQNRWMVIVDLGLSQNAAGTSLDRAEAARIAAAARLLNLQSEIIDGVERNAAVYCETAAEVAGIDSLIDTISEEAKWIWNEPQSSQTQDSANPTRLRVQIQLLTARLDKLDASVKLQTALVSLEDALQQPVRTERPQPSSPPIKAIIQNTQPPPQAL